MPVDCHCVNAWSSSYHRLVRGGRSWPYRYPIRPVDYDTTSTWSERRNSASVRWKYCTRCYIGPGVIRTSFQWISWCRLIIGYLIFVCLYNDSCFIPFSGTPECGIVIIVFFFWWKSIAADQVYGSLYDVNCILMLLLFVFVLFYLYTIKWLMIWISHINHHYYHYSPQLTRYNYLWITLVALLSSAFGTSRVIQDSVSLIK